MLDLAFVRDHLELVEEKLRQRGANPAEILKDFKEIDARRRQAITQAETLKAERLAADEATERNYRCQHMLGSPNTASA